MKKGFTLIELLAVIVILAVIVLIAIPVVLDVIDKSKEKTMIIGAKRYIDAVNQAILISGLDDNRVNDGIYKILENGNICLEYDSDNKCIKELKVESQGDKPTSGQITIKDEEVEDVILNLNDKVIVKNDNGSLEIKKPEKEEEPEIDNSIPAECFAYSDNEDGTITITDYTCGGENGTHKDVVIPREIDGKLVTTIGKRAFEYKFLTSVTIPESVTTIGSYTFYNNQLTSVTIPNSVTTIGGYAFMTNQLISVTIPDGLITLDEGVFCHNQLTNVEIPDSVTTIRWGVFAGNQLTSVTIPNSVTTIGNEAFSHNQLTSVTLGNSVTTIGAFAFIYNQLTSVTISESITTIGKHAFSDNQLTSVVIKGKSSTSDFITYGEDVFDWAEGYSDTNITWQP